MTLKQGQKDIDSEARSFERDLDKGLITALDTLLKRNNVDIADLKSYSLESSLKTESTSYKIVQAFIEGLKTTDR